MIWLRFQYGPAIGMGHAVRCLSLARALRDTSSEVGLLLDADAPELPGMEGLPVYPLSPGGTLPETGGIVFDISRRDTGEVLAGAIAGLTKAGRKCAVIDGLGADAYTAGPKPDLVLSPYLMPAGPGKRSAREWVAGPEFAILDSAYGEAPPALAGRKNRLLISIGGSDPWALTETALDAAHASMTLPRFEITVVAGPQLDTKRRSHLAARCRKLEVDMLEAPGNLRDALCNSAVAILGPGLTKYEAAACDTPVVILAPDAEALAINKPFAEAGLAFVMNAGERNFGGQLGAALGSQASKRRSNWRGRAIVDGKGAARSAAVIRAALGE